ncbi:MULTISPECIES: ABC transporter permease [unclassified Bacteroides]|jgi:putative ABC transport system permease protein|uniref:ABC transporter permease n=1 Tax=unclassified Bacteroides TaxID=2646097 RepID=UPI000E913935|nr:MULTISPECIES: FtsX-like permease family protein [unclassified Bacteroides]RGN49121.1 ABC transporter permease [Bacteroides sp. OM05-12]RHR83231.1 ABC transporter permease [Bacteroides sp. AF16-49]
MIKNILKQLWNQRRSNFWIALEIALVFVFLWFILNFIFKQYEAFNRPMGFNIEDVYEVKINNLPASAANYVKQEEFGTTSNEDLLTLLSRLRRVEGIEAVAPTSCSRPYSGCNGTRMFASIHGTDTIARGGMFRVVTPEYFDVFRILTPQGIPAGHENNIMLVLSKNLADTLQVARGDSAYLTFSETDWRPLVVGVSTEMRYAETWPDLDNGFLVLPEATFVGERWPDEICVRLNHGLSEDQRTALWEQVKQVCRINNLSYFYNTPFEKMRENYLRNATDEVKAQCWYAVFLLINIFLGVIGTFWFRTLHRRGEIGLRIAMGATRTSIFSFLIGEGILLLTVITPVAIVLMFNIVHFLIEDTSILTFITGCVVTWVLIAVMMFLGIWYPAYQAMKIEPAEALHDE